MSVLYLGLVPFGTLMKNNVEVPRPTRPWRTDTTYPPGITSSGDISDFASSPDMSAWTFSNTSQTPANALMWHKFQIDTRIVLICDRVILTNVSWSDLDTKQWISGNKVTIDGQGGTMRVLSGGTSYRTGSDLFSGGSPTNNEWDQYVTNELLISSLISPTSSDVDVVQGNQDLLSPHNGAWNWYGVSSWCQDAYGGNAATRVTRGYESAKAFHFSPVSYRSPSIGWRPVFEFDTAAPVINTLSTSSEEIVYQINEQGSAVVVTEVHINNILQYQRSYPTGTQIFYLQDSMLQIGDNTLQIIAIDSNGMKTIQSFNVRKDVLQYTEDQFVASSSSSQSITGKLKLTRTSPASSGVIHTFIGGIS